MAISVSEWVKVWHFGEYSGEGYFWGRLGSPHWAKYGQIFGVGRSIFYGTLFVSSMPEIPVGAQIFDVVFHPTFSTVYTGLLTGHVKAFSYDHQGNHQPVFSVRPSKSSCRGLSLDQDGSHLYAVGKSLKSVIQSLWPNPYLEYCFQHHWYSYREHW